MSDLIKKLLEISMNGLDKMDYNTIQCQLKTHTVSPPEYLAAFQKMYARYSMKLVITNQPTAADRTRCRWGMAPESVQQSLLYTAPKAILFSDLEPVM
jgi:hypothetical protein